jgi:folate-binding protein YgfZ
MRQPPPVPDPLEHEYDVIGSGVALYDRSDRGLLEVTGLDRAAWLHNLTTNQVKPLRQGEGNYAFCLNVQGRILFDLNILVRADSIWVDLDRSFLASAKKHFDKYTITEDIKVANRSDQSVRFALVGEGAKALLAKLGASHATALPLLGTADMSVADIPLTAARTDFCGPFAVEFFVPASEAQVFRQRLMAGGQIAAVCAEAMEIHRIEAGIPWPGREITDEYLPAETGQLGRAVSFQKGCYLGQEVVERMRSRGVVARLLRGLLVEDDAVPPQGASVADAPGKAVGTVTSSCRSTALKRPIAMAYLKTAAAALSQQVRLSWEGGSATATVVELPFTHGQAD